MSWETVKWFFRGAAPAELAGTAIIIALFLYEIWIQPWRRQSARRRELDATFGLTFDDDSASKIAPLGQSELTINLLLSTPARVDRFNLRFVTTRDGQDASRDVVTILGVQARRPTHAEWQSAMPDGKGGCTATWILRPAICRAGEAVHMTATVLATKPWSGFLSFRGYDADNRVQFVRLPIEFRGE